MSNDNFRVGGASGAGSADGGGMSAALQEILQGLQEIEQAIQQLSGVGGRLR
jgi:hypothetical protein